MQPGDEKRETMSCEAVLWVLPPVHEWAHIATNKAGIKGKEMSMQHANYVAFNNLTLWAYDQVSERMCA